MKMILVTGATGFLGGAIAQALVQKGERVRVLVRKTGNIDHLSNADVEIHYGDLRDSASVNRAVEGVHAIFHCAALSYDWGAWKDFYNTNVVGTINLLDAAVKNSDLKRFLHVSSTDVYGYPRTPPDETVPIKKTNLPYNRSKCMGEEKVVEYGKKYGLSFTIVRPVTIFGPRSKDFVVEVCSILERESWPYMENGSYHAGLLYIDNAVRAILKLVESDQSIGEIYNLRDDYDANWHDYIERIRTLLKIERPTINIPKFLAYMVGATLEIVYTVLRIRQRPLLTRHAVLIFTTQQSFPIHKIKQELGGEVTIVPFEEAVRKSIEWYQLYKNEIRESGK